MHFLQVLPLLGSRGPSWGLAFFLVDARWSSPEPHTIAEGSALFCSACPLRRALAQHESACSHSRSALCTAGPTQVPIASRLERELGFEISLCYSPAMWPRAGQTLGASAISSVNWG